MRCALAGQDDARVDEWVKSIFERDDMKSSVPPSDALEVLLRFGALMLRAGSTAFRTRKWIDAITPKLGFTAVSVIVSLDSITVSVRHGGDWLTAMRNIGPPGINVLRIAQLERLASATRVEATPAEIAVELDKSNLQLISTPSSRLPQPSAWQVAALPFSTARQRQRPLQRPSVAVAANGSGCG
jgi:uncharacterized membrane protein YjjP (DUF1212 family)